MLMEILLIIGASLAIGGRIIPKESSENWQITSILSFLVSLVLISASAGAHLAA